MVHVPVRSTALRPNSYLDKSENANGPECATQHGVARVVRIRKTKASNDRFEPKVLNAAPFINAREAQNTDIDDFKSHP